jgi:pyridoxamine 5'-phosphate oxidase
VEEAESQPAEHRLAAMADERDRPLRRGDLDPDPAAQFRRWLEEARRAGIEGLDAMTLATATRDGAPSARMVLLKGVEEHGLGFYTGYESRKGRELDENPRAALVLYWHGLGRQVRVEGVVERVPDEKADVYFASRPLGSRLSAVVSRQSEVIAGREELERAAEALGERVGEDVPRPASWGGYRVVPSYWEFWQHRLDRLHDRFRYRPGNGGWTIERLAP